MLKNDYVTRRVCAVLTSRLTLSAAAAAAAAAAVGDDDAAQ